MLKSARPIRFSLQSLGAVFSLLLGITFLLLSSIALGPDRELTLSRTIPSQLSPEHLDRQVSSFTRWPQWFYTLDQVKPVTGSTITAPNIPNGNFRKGDLLDLRMDPKKGIRKQFQLKAEVTEYIPGRELSLKIIEDTSGRLTQLFDRLEWKIEFKPKSEGGSLIHTTALAHTHHWRSRLFGGIAEKILLHQVFYPNALKLATLTQPFTVPEPEAPPVIAR